MAEERPQNPEHYLIRHKFLVDEVRNAFFFRFLIRLYALMENDDRRNGNVVRGEFTFGAWLDTLPSDSIVESVKSRYASITASRDYALMREKRHNFLAHNALTPRNITHSYEAVFNTSERIEQLYDELVAAGHADPVPWTGELDRRIVHPSNCPDGIETNVAMHFQILNASSPVSS